MTIIAFPPVEHADPSGMLATGGDLELDSLLLAYKSGVFPWPPSESELVWFAPNPRAILNIENYHCSRSFKRFLKKHHYTFKKNHDFLSVITHCATVSRSSKISYHFNDLDDFTKNLMIQKYTENSPDNHEAIPSELIKLINEELELLSKGNTWIFPNIISAYHQLHQNNYADSYEIYDEDKLIAGLYGVRIKNYFAAESMFHLKPNASKLAFHYLVNDLKKEGISWFDCQVINPFLETLGVEEIPRSEFMQKLNLVIS